MDEQQEEFILSDLDILTVGMVERGAVAPFGDGENIFLIKSEEETMDEEVTVEEVVEEETTTAETETPDEAVPEPQPVEEEAEESEEESLFEKFKQFLGKSKVEAVEEEAEQAQTEEPKAAPETKETEVSETKELLKTALEAQQESMRAGFQQQLEAQIQAITKAVEDKYEAQIQNLTQEVEQAKVEKAEAEAKRQQREYLTKTGQWLALGADAKQLADDLYTISQAVEPEVVERLEGVLKAADAQLGASGIFKELGTSRTPEEIELTAKVEQTVQKGDVDYGDALLQLSEAEQEQLLKEMREVKK